MELLHKINILANAAKYDVSCSSSGSKRANSQGGLGNASSCGICHSWSQDGRCISLLKILLTNYCIFDCLYCVNKISNDIERTFLTPEEVAEITISFYRRNYIEGLFLSSAVFKSPDYTMELMARAVSILRRQYRFNGYIHVKIIPGTDPALIEQIGQLSDRVSVNIEFPSSDSLLLLAPQKTKEAIMRPMECIKKRISEAKEDKALYRRPASFAPAGQTTQLIIGATPDSDLRILRLSESLYRDFNLKRIYFSGYVPVVEHPWLPSLQAAPALLREHRLYQADWLLRFYGFSAEEIVDETHPDLSSELDPKTEWALRNISFFPVEVNKADHNTLLRIPGIGLISAKRIIIARNAAAVDYELLKNLGVVLKRARYFITCKGKYYGDVNFDETLIRNKLTNHCKKNPASRSKQLELFSEVPLTPIQEHHNVDLSI